MSHFKANGRKIDKPIIVISPQLAEIRSAAKRAEKDGRISGARIDALTRVDFLARHGAGMPDTYKVRRIVEILDECNDSIARIEREYNNA